MAKLQIKQAVKREAKAHVALIGIPGSGKSLTSLKLARYLVGPAGKILALDSEGGSLSKYADVHAFDVIEPESFSMEVFQEAMDLAEENGYDAVIFDSMSHFWIGKDGALEFVDERKKIAKQRGGDQMDGWRDFTPQERKMVDRILRAKLHVIVTMRTKSEYATQEYTDSNGRTRTKRVKIGLAPVQRENLEYEFDLVGTMNEDNELMIEKSRVLLPDGTNPYQGRIISKPGPADFEAFREWLKGAPPEPPKRNRPLPEIDAELLGKAQAVIDFIGIEAGHKIITKHGGDEPADLIDNAPAPVRWARLKAAYDEMLEVQSALKAKLEQEAAGSDVPEEVGASK